MISAPPMLIEGDLALEKWLEPAIQKAFCYSHGFIFFERRLDS